MNTTKILEEAKKKPIEELIQFSILNMDKPAGPTSFSVDDYIRKSLGIKKTSHFGTLDPMVGGVLPVALGRACKLMEYFIHSTKTYVGIMHLHQDIDEKKLKEEIKNFTGKIKQTPPLRSRVKREERERTVYEFEILEKDEKEVLFRVKCEAGTYVRTLVHNLGNNIGGAHMTELRRVQASIFPETDKSFISLYDFDRALEELKKGNEGLLREVLIPGEIISKVLPVVKIKSDKEIIKKLYNGFAVIEEYLEEKTKLEKDTKIAVFCKEVFIGVYIVTSSDKLIAKPEFVCKPIT
jgi:H/ACA ribonucleoprotein complex subunit 4